MTIKTIIAALVTLIASWQPTTTLENDLADGILALNAANAVLPNNPLVGAALKAVRATQAGASNLASGQVAVVGTVGTTFEGQADRVLILAVRQSSPLAGQLGV